MYTIKTDITNEIIIKNSKFICVLHKIYNINDINNYLEQIKKEYKDATHYCYAYIINDNKKFNDDGEPSGTAGNPIMKVLEKNNLNYIMCIVIRYFGGIKLGSGGLIRTYSKSVTECLKLTNLNKLIEGYNIDIIFNYSDIENINYLLKNSYIQNKTYKDIIIYNVNINDDILNKLKEYKNIKLNIISKIEIEKDEN